MKKYKSYLILIIIMLFVSTTFIGCSCSGDNSLLGVWWWHQNIDTDKYINFAYENNVNEIYYYDGSLDDKTADFVSKANKKNISVYLLDGDKNWLNDNQPLYDIIDGYVEYQESYSSNQLSGIHLDIEPHQFDDFSDKREEYILKLISLCNDLKTRYPSVHFDYDIPFWLDDVVQFNGVSKESYKHIIDIADRVFVMSYRDTAESIYLCGEDEVEYAKQVGKTLFLCVETNSTEGDKVSFLEEGKNVMKSELSKLRNMLPENFGISIHYIETWYDLKD